MSPGESGEGGRILFEFIELGGQVRIAAIDEDTGLEIVTVAPATATRQQMQQLAAAKLRRALREAESQ